MTNNTLTITTDNNQVYYIDELGYFYHIGNQFKNDEVNHYLNLTIALDNFDEDTLDDLYNTNDNNG
tara:strand:+ start:163 stop:360 length:198 start_codon:yes stop_codon:yes gene_type:complete